MSLIAACVFVEFNATTGEFSVSNEKIYFYYNQHGFSPGTFALTHNGRNFSIVQIVRNIPAATPGALDKVTKHLLCVIPYEHSSYAGYVKELAALKTTAQAARLERKVDEAIKTALDDEEETDY